MRVWIGSIVLLSACQCASETEPLSLPDARSVTDMGPEGCSRATDCPGSFRPCEDFASCGCGTFKTCQGGTCGAVAIDCFDAAVAPDVGSLDAAVPVRCERAFECQGPEQRSVSVCPSSQHSCIDGQCVWECGSAHTCRVADGDCFICEGSQSCPDRRCMMFLTEATIEDATEGCANYPGPNTPFRGAKVHLVENARPCSTSLLLEGASASVGTFLTHDDRTLVATFPDFGGTCVGVEAPTGAIRFIFSCPRCQFVVGP